MTEELVLQLKFDGEDYLWRQNTDLTMGRLRHFKQWFGPDYGKASMFNLLLLQGDVDAIACVMWALLKEAGKNPPAANNLPDFSVGALYQGFIDAAEKPDEEPQEPGPTEVPTSGSRKTSTSSEPTG